jgi:hypothetical protein
LWGKFSQRLELPKTIYLTEEDLQNKLKDATLEIKGIEVLENTDHPETDMMLINYQENKHSERIASNTKSPTDCIIQSKIVQT